ncbi:MAG: alpha/beta fold hydrolase [Bryobacteraceae bacterium]|nr:alpha/beta fold hydrolase [Bryobacteraceae bacterium]
MRILLAHNSTYYPAHGGGDRSNRLLMEALAARGHDVRVITRIEKFGEVGHRRLLEELAKRGVDTATNEDGAVCFRLRGVDTHTLALSPQLRGYFQKQIASFDPDIIVTSTDDPGHLLFEPALNAPRAHVVYLVRATIAVPFGPDASSSSTHKTEMLRRADLVVGVSNYVADYVRKWGGIDAVHVPISLLDPVPEYPLLGRFESRYISMVNPCAVKGIDILLQLAERMPHREFAAIPTWGTTPEDLAAMGRLANITIMDPVDNIDDLLRLSRAMIVPSVWAEARSRVIVEAMSRGVPVLASDVGGIPEAKLGVPYLLPVNPVVRYRLTLDENLVPVAEVPPQDVAPWQEALERLSTDREHWDLISRESRRAALDYAQHLTAEPFERLLLDVVKKPKRESKPAPSLTDEKRRLLAMRLKQRAAVRTEEKDPWFPWIEEAEGAPLRLFCFPYAGGGALPYRPWKEALNGIAAVCPVRLPGRETRAHEPLIDDMATLLNELRRLIEPYLAGGPFAFYGHSMGAAIAFELVRRLRADGLPLPRALYVSGARAPQFRRNYTPAPEPHHREFLEQLRKLDGFPANVLDRPELLKLAMPALLADARLYRNYVYREDAPLDLPIVAYGGEADPNVQPHHVEAWREQTTKAFACHVLPGGHFFIQQRAFPERLRLDLAG